MPVVTERIEMAVTWSQQLDVRMQHANLTDTLSAVMRGIAQAARNEGTYIDPSNLPTDEDE